ncbi:GNAT family N-acetyltransferase [Cellulomonas edaphi]|uniref:N-acetyltransferase family protein n=1 Tax=Cellulomonas edaphi TaxID=3053468 RepID=A0ABT7SBR1_9CELL|nr:GNAT family N-acetyltransferase [Cellulomons edaphi]MDM7832432.1 N-acetyltransferase family protein [Cellulomons edaphi]
MAGRLTVREASGEDAAACARIYAPFVLGTAVTFETEAPPADELARRIDAAHVWLVAEIDGEVRGYAYAGTFRARPAYRWTCEVSAYVEQGHGGGGIGRALYADLLPRLAARGYRTAVAGMTVPNEASAALHRTFGFEPVGTYREVGWKLGAWRDVHWVQLMLSDADGPPG